ncbi:solute carrier family 22 member 3 [Platysternon megacephalum]|uniref:Large ribosomal subunit protein P2 n=1 Tax=Platysternon megacephalum TaxID=55544 RepID=A0A4D9DYG7_9SAUR|nr:solute carrier family 22 member 3 [Platysternon megacephalum]
MRGCWLWKPWLLEEVYHVVSAQWVELLHGSRKEMRYVAAYLLAVLGGNESPASKDLKKILDSVGIETDDERLNKVIGELNGKNIEDVIAQGNGKLASMPVGGAVAVSAGPGSAAAPAAAPAAAEEKKEEKKEESEESDDDMGFGLFD